MNTIRLTCNEHGNIELGSHSVTAYTLGDGKRSWYDFECSHLASDDLKSITDESDQLIPDVHRHFVSRPCGEMVLTMLLSAGVELVTIEGADPYSENEEVPAFFEHEIADQVANLAIELARYSEQLF